MPSERQRPVKVKVLAESQSQSTVHFTDAPNDNTAKSVETAPIHTVFHEDVNGQSDNNEEWEAHIRLDSNKLCWELEDESENEEEGVRMNFAARTDLSQLQIKSWLL